MKVEARENDYPCGALHESPVRQFEFWLNQAQEAQIGDANVMTLATVSADGQPSQRAVVLKHFDDSGFIFYTSLHSRKAQEIAANPKVSLYFAWLPLKRQVVISGYAEKLSMGEIYHSIARAKSRLFSPRQLLGQQMRSMKEKLSRGKIPIPNLGGGYRVCATAIEFWQGHESKPNDRFFYRYVDEGWQITQFPS